MVNYCDLEIFTEMLNHITKNVLLNEMFSTTINRIFLLILFKISSQLFGVMVNKHKQ